MKTIFSTDELRSRDRFDCWHEVACKEICGHLSVPESAARFEAEMQTGQLGALKLFTFRNSPMDVARTQREIAKADIDDIIVCHQFAGRLALEQQTRQVVLEAGDFCLLDPLQPYSGHFYRDSKLFIMTVGRRALQARVGNLSAITVRHLGEGATGKLTAGYLSHLPACADEPEERVADALQEQVLDLLALTLAGITDQGGVTLSSPRALSEAKLRAVVEQNLSSPALSPAMVARLAGISVRYANALLARQGTSLYRFILSLRLDRCRRALEDPGQIHRTVTEIALSWGFTDLPYFSRTFKAAFGASPRDFRAAALDARNL
jgi:AraC-like DNA-binding protein